MESNYGDNDEDLISQISEDLNNGAKIGTGKMSKTWKKQGQNNVIVAQALEALSKDKNLSRQQKMTLRNQSNNAVQAKQTMAAMGWEFDPTKNRKEQVQGKYIFQVSIKGSDIPDNRNFYVWFMSFGQSVK